MTFLRDRMKSLIAAAAFAAIGAVGGAVLVSGGELLGQSSHVTVKEEVRQIEAAFVPDVGELKVRVHLISGLALDYETKQSEVMDRILGMTHILSSKRAHMFVEVVNGRIQSFQVSVP